MIADKRAWGSGWARWYFALLWGVFLLLGSSYFFEPEPVISGQILGSGICLISLVGSVRALRAGLIADGGHLIIRKHFWTRTVP